MIVDFPNLTDEEAATWSWHCAIWDEWWLTGMEGLPVRLPEVVDRGGWERLPTSSPMFETLEFRSFEDYVEFFADWLRTSGGFDHVPEARLKNLIDDYGQEAVREASERLLWEV